MRPKQAAILAALLFLDCSLLFAQKERVGVLGIFHSQQLILSSIPGEPVVVSADGRTIFLSAGSNSSIANLRVSGEFVMLEVAGRVIRARKIRAASSNNGAVDFVLGIPGKIERRYSGTLDVTVAKGELVPTITMDLETAVASVLQAESEPNTPVEALKAQAVVTRSYFVAGGGRHANFDFCDLTHCQFLREPPRRESQAALAASATRGLIITFENTPLAAMFTRSCGGKTQTLAAIGVPAKNYPYFSVRCDACYKNPVRWTRRVSPQDAGTLEAQREAGRLSIDRRLGWSAVPSNNFTIQNVDREVVLHGAGEGHGVGFCQRGARAMAAEGEDFGEIIRHYFPNTALGNLEMGSP